MACEVPCHNQDWPTLCNSTMRTPTSDNMIKQSFNFLTTVFFDVVGVQKHMNRSLHHVLWQKTPSSHLTRSAKGHGVSLV